ncbi:MAG: ATP-binding protein [Acidobacteria bacterium]|nr:ATP-binding protein [Acidobacteriota bacterium]
MVKVTVGSKLEYVDLLQMLAENITRMMKFDEEAVYRVGMSTRESVANAICHGNKQDASKWVQVEFEIYEDRLVINVDDAGEGFDPAELADPLAQENLLKPCGRGILFVRTFMDEVDFLPSPAGGTRLKMTKRMYLTEEGERHEHRQ